jgi:hypothetical protein
LVRRRYRTLVATQRLVANETVLVPNPLGELKGHPHHLYYTIAYDASRGDVRLKGCKKGLFAYTSVTCYGEASMPPANFKYDDTLLSDFEVLASRSGPPCAEPSAAGAAPAAGGGEREDDGVYTVFLTVAPTFAPPGNELDVSTCPAGVCLVRLIYPDSAAEIERCTPKVALVERGCRALIGP